MKPTHGQRRFEQVSLESIAPLRRDEPRRKVLNLSPDPLLLQTRAAILERTGVLTVNAGSAAEAVWLCRSQHFDAVVVCHSLDQQQRQLVMQAARRGKPGTTVIGLYNLTRANAAGADLVVDTNDGPEALLKAVRTALCEERRRSPRRRT